MRVFMLAFFVVMFMASSAFAYMIATPKGKTLKVHWAILEAKPGKMPDMAAISSRTVAKYTPNESGSYALYGAIAKENHDLMRILEI